MRVSLVIPTFNRARILEKTIPALLGLQMGKHSVEIIFVSNGSTDATGEILSKLEAEHPGLIRYFRIEPTGGPSAPRNAGIRHATGDVVLITDDDVAPDSDMALRHAEYHEAHPEAEAAALGQVYVPAYLMRDPMSVFHDHYNYGRFAGKDVLTCFDFWTCNVSFKRRFMLDHGMFNESILYLEDIEVGYRLQCAGMQLRYLPDSCGQHLHEASPSTLAKRAFNLGMWLHRVTAYVPGEQVKRRFGLVTTELGPSWFARRLVRHASFLLFANPFTEVVLRLAGGASKTRGRLTDVYYGLIFRRAFFAGYYRTAAASSRGHFRRVREQRG